MTLLWPWALAGWTIIPILVYLDRRRRRPRALVWPSLQLWTALPDASRTRRRRFDPLLWCECAAVFLLALAAAEPRLDAAPRPDGFTVLLDSGPATTREETLAEVRRMGEPARILEADEGFSELAARLPDALLATARPDVAPGRLAVGRARPGFNAGVAAVEVTGTRVWFVVAADGGPAEIAVRLDGRPRQVVSGAPVEAEGVREIEVVQPDNYDGDDLCRLRPLAVRARHDTGSRLVDAAFRAGIPVVAGDDLVVTARGGTLVEGVVRGAECTARGALCDGLLLDECVWRGATTVAGEGLLNWRGRALIAWRDDATLFVGLPLDREWDDHYTLAVFLERAKRSRVRLAAGDAIVGDAIASPAPRFARTGGVDRPWDGRTRPPGSNSSRSLRPWLAGAAALALALCLALLIAPRGG